MEQIEKEFSIADIIAKTTWTEESLSPGERALLDKWLDGSEENRMFYEKCKSGLPARDYDEVTGLFDKDKQWEALVTTLKPARGMNRMRWIGYAAGVVVLAAAGAWFGWNGWNEREPVVQVAEVVVEPVQNRAVLKLANGQSYYIDARDTLLNTSHGNIRIDGGRVSHEANADSTGEVFSGLNTIQVPKGGIYTLVLGDGTQVFFNSDSELTYPAHFTGDTREVVLKGEASFNVKPDPVRPFIVRAGELYTKVLGTTFDIFAYENEPVIKATLLSGSIEVYTGKSGRVQRLKPGMQAVLKKGEAVPEIREVDIEAQSRWKDGIIVLDKDDLGSVMRMIARWYNVTVVYENAASEKHTFTGLLDRNADLKSVLETLTLIGGPEFKMEETTVFVY